VPTQLKVRRVTAPPPIADRIPWVYLFAEVRKAGGDWCHIYEFPPKKGHGKTGILRRRYPEFEVTTRTDQKTKRVGIYARLRMGK